MGKDVEPEDVEGDWERQSDGNGVGYDGRRCRMDGTTSGASGDSKRVDTRSLAEVRSSQQERRKRTMAHAPRPSTPTLRYARSLSDHVDPPRRRGRLKTRPRNVSYPRWTYQATRTRRGRIGRIERAGYVAYRPEMAGERCRTVKREDGGAGVDRGRARALGQRNHH